MAEIISLVFTLALLILAILYLSALADTVRFIAVENQKINPTDIWWLILPIYNYYWYYKVVVKVSESIKAEYTSRNIQIEEKPLYRLGLATAIAMSVNGVLYFIEKIEPDFIHTTVYLFSSSLLYLSGITIWIVYWVHIARYRKAIKAFRQADVQ